MRRRVRYVVRMFVHSLTHEIEWRCHPGCWCERAKTMFEEYE